MYLCHDLFVDVGLHGFFFHPLTYQWFLPRKGNNGANGNFTMIDVGTFETKQSVRFMAVPLCTFENEITTPDTIFFSE